MRAAHYFLAAGASLLLGAAAMPTALAAIALGELAGGPVYRLGTTPVSLAELAPVYGTVVATVAIAAPFALAVAGLAALIDRRRP